MYIIGEKCIQLERCVYDWREVHIIGEKCIYCERRQHVAHHTRQDKGRKRMVRIDQRGSWEQMVVRRS